MFILRNPGEEHQIKLLCVIGLVQLTTIKNLKHLVQIVPPLRFDVQNVP